MLRHPGLLSRPSRVVCKDYSGLKWEQDVPAMRGFSSTVKNCQHSIYCREARMECVVMISVDKLASSDRDTWEALFRAYIDFYQRIEPPEMYERAWREFQADTRLHALGARLDGRLVGITHFLIHHNTS